MDCCCTNSVSFWAVLGLSHHNASAGDGDKWVIVPCGSNGGSIYITSKSMLDNVGKHCAEHCHQIQRDVPEINLKKKDGGCNQFPPNPIYRALGWSLPDVALSNSHHSVQLTSI